VEHTGRCRRRRGQQPEQQPARNHALAPRRGSWRHRALGHRWA
jgi:hypothetical protein